MGEYTQDGGARGNEQENSQRNPPFYSAYDAEFCAADTPEVEYLAPETPPTSASVSSTVARLFNFEGHTIRAIKDEQGKPWFVAKDVAAVLDYADTDQAVRVHCKHAELLKPVKSTGLGFPNRGAYIINRGDVFRLILRSKLPAAERFENWIMDEVIPAIMDHGGYLTPEATEEALNDPDFIIGLANKLKEERAKSAALRAENARIATEKLRIAQENAALAIAKQKLAQANAVMEPKVVLHDALMEADGAVEMDEAAKTLYEEFPKLGRNKLFEALFENFTGEKIRLLNCAGVPLAYAEEF